MNANFTSHTAFEIDFTPTLQHSELWILLDLLNAIDRTYFKASFASGAIIRVDDGKLFG